MNFKQFLGPVVKNIEKHINKESKLPPLIKSNFVQDIKNVAHSAGGNLLKEADQELHFNQHMKTINQKFFMHTGKYIPKTKVVFKSLFD